MAQYYVILRFKIVILLYKLRHFRDLPIQKNLTPHMKMAKIETFLYRNARMVPQVWLTENEKNIYKDLVHGAVPPETRVKNGHFYETRLEWSFHSMKDLREHPKTCL